MCSAALMQQQAQTSHQVHGEIDTTTMSRQHFTALQQLVNQLMEGLEVKVETMQKDRNKKGSLKYHNSSPNIMFVPSSPSSEKNLIKMTNPIVPSSEINLIIMASPMVPSSEINLIIMASPMVPSSEINLIKMTNPMVPSSEINLIKMTNPVVPSSEINLIKMANPVALSREIIALKWPTL
ncbi:hypothetical protein RRG08_020332 [Elysia crispata]|uniref:Uncharacterized protein n=1 Tax=Elysia crispata TaxID=231223 RepID=A0AAE0Y1I8_9GAST|nr:hypothetical protein RRG08_020332 [Elysia crispata]